MDARIVIPAKLPAIVIVPYSLMPTHCKREGKGHKTEEETHQLERRMVRAQEKPGENR